MSPLKDVRARRTYQKEWARKRTNSRWQGIFTLEDYAERFQMQDGKCAICGREETDRKLSLDHDSKTNICRALLCRKCNLGLGQFNHDPEMLRAAALYLEAFNE